MKIGVPIGDFREAFGVAEQFLAKDSKKAQRPEYASALVRATEDRVTITGHDAAERVAVRRPVPNAAVDRPGDVLLPREIVGKAVAAIAGVKEGDVILEVVGDRLKIRVGKTKWDLPTADPAGYPDPFPAIAPSPEPQLSVSGPDLIRAIDRTIPACDPDSTRYALGGPQFRLDGDRLVLTASDGRGLVRTSIPAEPTGGELVPAVIPASALARLRDAFGGKSNPAATVEVAITRHDARFVGSDGSVVALPLTEGRFPDMTLITEVTPATWSGPFEAREFVAAVEKAAVVHVGITESRAVSFALRPALIRMKAVNSVSGDAATEYDAELSGPPGVAFLDPARIAMLLKPLKDEAIKVGLTADPLADAFLIRGERFDGWVMPMTVADIEKAVADA